MNFKTKKYLIVSWSFLMFYAFLYLKKNLGKNNKHQHFLVNLSYSFWEIFKAHWAKYFSGTGISLLTCELEILLAWSCAFLKFNDIITKSNKWEFPHILPEYLTLVKVRILQKVRNSWLSILWKVRKKTANTHGFGCLCT